VTMHALFVRLPFAVWVATVLATAQTPATLSWRCNALPAAAHHGMVFDLARQRFVLRNASTWEWDGNDWRERRTDHRPTATSDFGMVYDSTRNRTVLFGGMVDVYTMFQQIWEYDGFDWTERSSFAGPSARSSPAIAYDPIRQRVVVFGGKVPSPGGGISYLSDTWTWNGSSWSQVAGPGPVATAATMAFHSPTGRIVLSGWTQSSNTVETWTFDGAAWLQEHPITTPPPCYDQRRAWEDPAQGVVRMLGGTEPLVWSWNGTDWSASPGPARVRGYAAIACDPAGTTLLAGGSEVAPLFGTLFPGIPTGDTWRCQAGTWTLVQDTGPYASDLQLAYDLVHDRVLGSDRTTIGRRTFEWSQGRWHENVGAQLPQLFGARMCHDFLRDRLVLFGGGAAGLSTVSTAPTDSLFEYDGMQWTQVLAPGPSPRSKHAFAFDVARGEAVLFGGNDSQNDLGDTWAWNGVQWRLLTTAGPAPRFSAAMAADPSRANIVLFGGYAGLSTILGDTWVWNGTSWQQAPASVHPPARHNAALEFDWTRHRLVFVGGQGTNGAVFNDAWAWDGAAWTQLTGGILETLSSPLDRSSIANMGNGMLRVANRATWVASPTVATVTSVGSGCGGLVPRLIALGDPVLGSSTFAADIQKTSANSPFLLGVGAGPAPTNLGSGCTLQLQTIDLAFFGLTSALGHAVVVLPVPDSPSLRGITAAIQAAVLRPSAPLGFALTNALSARIGD